MSLPANGVAGRLSHFLGNWAIIVTFGMQTYELLKMMECVILDDTDFTSDTDKSILDPIVNANVYKQVRLVGKIE